MRELWMRNRLSIFVVCLEALLGAFETVLGHAQRVRIAALPTCCVWPDARARVFVKVQTGRAFDLNGRAINAVVEDITNIRFWMGKETVLARAQASADRFLCIRITW